VTHYFRTPYSISIVMLTLENLCIFYITTQECEAGVASEGTKDTLNFIKISQYVPEFKDTPIHHGDPKNIFLLLQDGKIG